MKNDKFDRIASSRIDLDKFKKEVDSLTVEYATTEDKNVKIRLCSRIVELYLADNGSIEYYWNRLFRGCKDNNELYQNFTDDFYETLLRCLDSYKPEKGSKFRTYFETSIIHTQKKILNRYNKAHKLLPGGNMIDNEEGKPRHKLIELDNTIFDDDGNSIPVEETLVVPTVEDDDDNDRAEDLFIKCLSAVSNFLKSAGNTERMKNKKIYFSTVHTRWIIGFVRDIKAEAACKPIYKHESETMRSLNDELIGYTYVNPVNSIAGLANDSLKK